MLCRIELSLYWFPAAILGSVMIARGELGYLKSSLAKSKAILSSCSEDSDPFLIVTWSIKLCTVVGHLAVDTCAKSKDTAEGS